MDLHATAAECGPSVLKKRQRAISKRDQRPEQKTYQGCDLVCKLISNVTVAKAIRYIDRRLLTGLLAHPVPARSGV